MPEEGVSFVPHENILSYEEMLHLVRVFVAYGIRKVRLTGGEPLVRKGLLGFLRELSEIRGLEEITLTTNGVLLKEMAADIKECGICRINISLDSLNRDRFRAITGRDHFLRVWEGIEETERVGFSPIKINVVVMRGINDDEIVDFGRLTLEKPYHVRFIEFMPVGMENGWCDEKFMASEEIAEKIKALGELRHIDPDPFGGPAQRYAIGGGKGEIGFIGALSNHFCARCNRLRLTAEGHLRSCLFSDQEIDIKTPLREGEDDETLLELIKLSVETKPENHELLNQGPRKCMRRMSSIGG
jgi:cyclic pyranopterin phosphate synthase